MKIPASIVFALATLALCLPVGFHGPQVASAQQAVRVVSDTAESTLTNTLKTILIEVSSAITADGITSLTLKETVLDPIAWNMAKQLQQQLTGNLLKWIGGQLPEQEGQVPFVQNYSEYYQNVIDQVVGDYLFNDKAGDAVGQCDPEHSNRVITAAYNSYVSDRQKSQAGGALQCGDSGASDAYESAADRILGHFLTCQDELCGYYATQEDLALRTANAIANERQILTISRGMLPQRVCQTVESDSGQSQRCDLTNPLYLMADTVSFQLAEMPGWQLLEMDEFNEVISNFVANLTNQALTGLNGVLGLSGNPSYSSNVFGPEGNLSYVDALLQDDISLYQSQTESPIKEVIEEENEYIEMLEGILAEIASIENKLEENRQSFGSCFDMTLSADLTKAKEDSTLALQIATTSLSVLLTLDEQYDAASDAGTKQSIISTFISYKDQGFFRTSYQNEEFEVMYVDVTFAQMADKFRYDMAVKRQSCGGDFDYDGVLTEGSDGEGGDGTDTGNGEGQDSGSGSGERR